MSPDERRPAIPCDRGADVASYVLGSLPANEREEFEQHLATCAGCRRDVADLCVVADALPLAAEQVPPPPELKDRVMAVVRAEAEAAHAAAAPEGEAAESAAAPEAEAARPAAAPEADRRVRKPAREPWWRRMTLRLAPLPAVAAAVLLLAIGAGGALLLSRSSTSDVPAQVHLASAPSASATVELRDGRARLKVSRMPAPPAGKVYEVWLKPKNGAPRPTDALFAPTRAGDASVDVPGSVGSGDQVLVTAEPDGGSATPTSDPVIVSEPA